jgi:hypothetical protein
MSELWTTCAECHLTIHDGDEAVLIGDKIVHIECADEMLENGEITQATYDAAIPYDLEEQASYDEQYRDPWSW